MQKEFFLKRIYKSYPLLTIFKITQMILIIHKLKLIIKNLVKIYIKLFKIKLILSINNRNKLKIILLIKKIYKNKTLQYFMMLIVTHKLILNK
jgi:hypothetical protein